tara:strand:+ start:58 stop:1689 length:1632 start_codon:yes stop_codon:yes gene_type:complete
MAEGKKSKDSKSPLIWKFDAQAYVSSPILINEILYFGAEDYNHLYALDIKSGKEQWNFKPEEEYGSIKSPISTEGVLYFGSTDYHFYAVDSKTGKEKWKFEAGGGIYSSPVISDGIVYFGCDDCHLYAVDSKTGKEKWKFETDDTILCTPSIIDGIIYFGSQDYFIYALNTSKGEVKWKFEAEGYIDGSATVVHDNSVYFTAQDNFLYALNIKDGKEKWKFETKDGIYNSTPIVKNDIIYFGSDDCHLYAVDSKTGEGKWRYETDGGINTSPLISDGVIYFGSQDHHYYAVDTTIAQELAPAEKVKEKELKEIENQRNVEADKNNITNDDIKNQYVSGEINLEEAIQLQSKYNKEEKIKNDWKIQATNNLIRVNCERSTDLDSMLILKGCLVLVLDPDSGWAYGNHIKSQGGDSFTENHIIMKHALNDNGTPNWNIVIGQWFGGECSQEELIDTASNLNGFNAKKAEVIFEVVNEIWSKYVELGTDENLEYESIYLCRKDILPSLEDDELWYNEDNFDKDNIMSTIDIESVSERVQGNMIFIS